MTGAGMKSGLAQAFGILSGGVGLDVSRYAQTREGAVLNMCPANTGPTYEGGWSAVEHRTLFGAVKPGGPFRQLGVCPNMQEDCGKQLGHVRKRANPGIACMAARGKTEFA